MTAACRPARGLFGLGTACVHGGADRVVQVGLLSMTVATLSMA